MTWTEILADKAMFEICVKSDGNTFIVENLHIKSLTNIRKAAED